MKSRFLILLSIFLFTLSVQAQPGPGGGMGRMNPEIRMQELIATLEISPQQEPAFREAMVAIAQQQIAAMEAMRQGGGGGGDGQGRARRAEMQAQTEAALAPVLTETQMAKFREVEAARMEEMRRRMMQRQQ